MQQFLEAIVVGGLAVVAGLWYLSTQAGGTLGWYAGVAFALAGLVTIGLGIWLKLEPAEA